MQIKTQILKTYMIISKQNSKELNNNIIIIHKLQIYVKEKQGIKVYLHTDIYKNDMPNNHN